MRAQGINQEGLLRKAQLAMPPAADGSFLSSISALTIRCLPPVSDSPVSLPCALPQAGCLQFPASSHEEAEGASAYPGRGCGSEQGPGLQQSVAGPARTEWSGHPTQHSALMGATTPFMRTSHGPCLG